MWWPAAKQSLSPTDSSQELYKGQARRRTILLVQCDPCFVHNALMKYCRTGVFGDARKLGQVVGRIVAWGTLVLTPALVAQVRPRGIYAVVNVEDEISTLQTANPLITVGQLDAGFNSFYQVLPSNPAVAGLAVRPYWATLNPNPPGAANAYYWNLVDDAFNQAALWNSQNPARAMCRSGQPSAARRPPRGRVDFLATGQMK